jgi:hypothetical protein
MSWEMPLVSRVALPHGVEVTQEIEHDGLAIGTHVE